MKSNYLFDFRPISLLSRLQSELSPKVVAVAVAYLITSTALVFASKSAMANYNFPFPITLTALQQLAIALFTFTIGNFRNLLEPLSFLPRAQLDKQLFKKLIPLSVIYALFLVSGSICLYFTKIWYYQLIRAFTPLFTTLFVFAFFRLKQKNVIIPWALIISGFIFVSVNGNGGDILKNSTVSYSRELFGIFFGIASTAFGALYSLKLKKTIETIKSHEWAIVNHVVLESSIILSVFSLFSGELWRLFSAFGATSFSASLIPLLVSIFAAAVAAGTTFYQSELATPLTAVMMGTMKYSCIFLLGFLSSKGNVFDFVGGLVMIFGVTCHSVEKWKENESRRLSVKAVQEDIAFVEEGRKEEEENTQKREDGSDNSLKENRD